MRRKKIHIERNLDTEQVAGFLRALADEIEGRCPSSLEQYGIDLQDFQKIKVGLRKGETGELILKIKVRGSRPEKKRHGSLSYKHLKKRMKATFSLLGGEITAGAVGGDLLAAFLEDARQMISFPGYGDEFYEEFSDHCDALADAHKNGDMAGMRAAFTGLARCKKDCHDRFK